MKLIANGGVLETKLHCNDIQTSQWNSVYPLGIWMHGTGANEGIYLCLLNVFRYWSTKWNLVFFISKIFKTQVFNSTSGRISENMKSDERKFVHLSRFWILGNLKET